MGSLSRDAFAWRLSFELGRNPGCMGRELWPAPRLSWARLEPIATVLILPCRDFQVHQDKDGSREEPVDQVQEGLSPSGWDRRERASVRACKLCLLATMIVVIVVQEQDDIKHLQADSDVCFCTRKRFIWSKKQLWLRIYRSDRYSLHLGLRWSWAPLMPCLVGVYSFLWYICESTSSGLWSIVSGSSGSLAIKWALWIVCFQRVCNLNICAVCVHLHHLMMYITAFADFGPSTCGFRQSPSRRLLTRWLRSIWHVFSEHLTWTEWLHVCQLFNVT